MKQLSLISLLVLQCAFVWNSATAADNSFPLGPDPTLTPGSLCGGHSEYRYPEKIPYCNRSVGSGLKKSVIQTYDSQLGYHVGDMTRSAFKIDHYIPLCMGGSNSPDNLWPQHESVYRFTDPLEGLLCQKMADGKLKQEEAIRIIKEAKANISEADQLLKYVHQL